MELKTLREIGKVLLKKIPAVPAFEEGDMRPKGAAGDRTYPVDKKAEEIIFEALRLSGEPLSIISEEAGLVELKGGGKKVLIDPVDGSKNAATGIPFYCTSIAIADGDRIKDIVLAYVINLVNGDEFWAKKGGGAYRNGAPAAPQKDDELRLIAYEAQIPSRDIPAIMPLLSKSRRTRCLGATALDLAYLSSGAVSVFVTPALSRSFDFGAGWLLVRESGGVFTDMEGKGVEEIELGIKRVSAILASANEALHGKALKLLEGRL
ncbi:MAG: inositol monophosphatase family protein [Thermodesulfovibrionales bacterium]|nr:inositol monophosphatase family protein [Thermodesulfovibrionales bacterium]